jgi:glycosidase
LLGLFRSLAWPAATAVLGAACEGGPSYPTADCHQVVWAQANDGTDVHVIGSWDGWSTPGIAAGPSGHAGWQIAILDLPPGRYGYQVEIDGTVGLDPYQPLTTFRGVEEVSLLTAADCTVPVVSLATAAADDAGALSVTGTFTAAAGGPALDPASVSATVDGQATPGAQITARPADGTFSVAAAGLVPGKHTVAITAADTAGKPAVASAAVWVQPAAETWDDAVLYQIVTDRFRGEGGATLAAPPTPGTRAGGTLSGITAEIERGTFAALGVTALWISPLYTNPEGFQTGLDGRLSQGYHGYWPLADRAVDPNVGGEAEADALMAAAHAHGLRVLFDIVPHHVYQANPRYLAHTGDGWFQDAPGYCMCGNPGCDWSTHILSCWFDPWLPTVNFENDSAMEDAVATAVFWMNRFDADGVRIDAVPMVPRAASRRIAAGLRAIEAPARSHFVLGEVFTGSGLGGIDQIKYFLGPNGLDSAFDFPLMWAMQDAIATGAGGFDEVETILEETEAAHAGSGTVEARMLDNHDVPRFLSVASGDDVSNPWTKPPPQPPAGDPSYARQRLALGLIFSLPGMPIFYYGDELGLAGATDPDSRRVMPAADALLPDQSATLALSQRLGKLRGCSAALRRGTRVPMWDDADTLAFARDAGDGSPVVAVFSRSGEPTMVSIPGGVVPAGMYVDAMSGTSVSLTGAAAVPMEPMSFRILVPAGSPCRM